MIEVIRIIRKKTNPAWYWLAGYSVLTTVLLVALLVF
jgi:hypothetical protein